MFLDKKNNRKVVIEKENSKGIVIARDLKTGKRYLVEKSYLVDMDKK